MNSKKRKSGVLMHISSLPGEYSTGSFGKEAKEFIDFLSSCGFSMWQVLPFCLVDECNSPYKSYSAFGGNPYFVDLPTLYEQGLLTKEELDSCRQQTPYSCEFVRLYHTRTAVLMNAAKRADESLKSKISAFIDGNLYLKQFCEFMALKKANGEKPWTEWETQDYDPEVLFLWQFIQYEFFTQWAEIKKYANDKGIKIIGDIPIYVSFDSCDVWANKEQFLLDKDNVPACVAGVPPDYFAEEGQLWGKPIYDWAKMEKDSFKWWRARLSHNLEMFDAVRIDHFRGIESYWSVDGKATTAKDGRWVKGPGKKFVDMAREIAGEKLIIAEDLGDITKEVIDLVEYSGFPGMRVFQFGFLSDSDNPHQPHNYTDNCIAYTGTHDNNTLLGYVWELSEETRKGMLEYCGYYSPDWNNGYSAIIRTIFASHADTVILPIQDLLGYGSDTRLNIPGKADGNWQYRVTAEQIASIDKNRWKRLNYLYRR
ncbi:MAG: 4-alpha-glucanotransferase [Clostridia bacterium]|nr:4-alpha-glucanotransferase [Clostridia bacterium]